MATAWVCDVEEAWHGCPSGPHSCWHADESQGKDSAAGHVVSIGYYFILHTPWQGSVLGQVALSLPEPRPTQGRAGWMRLPFFGDGREPHHMDKSCAEPPIPKPESRPRPILFTSSDRGIPSFPSGACLCAQPGRSVPGRSAPSNTKLPPSHRSWSPSQHWLTFRYLILLSVTHSSLLLSPPNRCQTSSILS